MKRKITVIPALLTLVLVLSACGATDAVARLLGKTAEAASEDVAVKSGDMEVLSVEDDQRVKSLINDYFSSLYAQPVESYLSDSLTGKIPPNIKDFIAKSTIATAEGNPEIGLHLPRYLEMNGLVAIGYTVNEKTEKDARETLLIDSGFAGNRNGSSYYYVKIDLTAKCVNKQNFNLLYSFNGQTKLWQKKDNQPVSEGILDYVRMEARYDVEARKDDGTYKLVTVKEANTRNTVENRLLTYNNDFVARLPYLNISKKEDGKAYVNENDQKIYEEEKAVILSFFKSLSKSFNSESMKLLYTKWQAGTQDFKGFLALVGQPADDNTKKLADYMDIKEDYRTRFDYDSFPLQPGMERLQEEFSGMEIVPHPGYTKKQKVYAVTFNAPLVTAVGGIEGKEGKCGYSYIVNLTRTNEVVKVSGIKLYECSGIQ